MSSAGRCIARSTSSGMLVGPGIARNSRPARTTIVVVPCSTSGPAMDAGKGCEIQPVGALFSERFGDRGPDLILEFGCRRARNRHRGSAPLFLPLRPPPPPHLAAGVIEVAAPNSGPPCPDYPRHPWLLGRPSPLPPDLTPHSAL